MSAIPPKARSYDLSVFESLMDLISLETYSIPLLESLLTHFQMEKLPKARSYAALDTLFIAKPMLAIMACLCICLDNCYKTRSLLQTTADRVHDCIEGILSWTLLLVDHVLAPKSKDPLQRKELVGEFACLLLARLLRIDTRIDQVVTESEKTFEVIIKCWPACDILTPPPSNIFALILREHMDATQERFEKDAFITYLLSDEKRLPRLAKGVVAHLDKVREMLEGVKPTDETFGPLQRALKVLTVIVNRLSRNQLMQARGQDSKQSSGLESTT
ncbi:hypothetical protein CC2G_007977 [Coprinopsis cinerea AmutBmut pab1-1]|nr:hypothetical protein CC2G_007977 [Coprinopsis cinerea AmutBmut pab1-1]